jgi:uncharacterized protein YndB with AHSA1/START domain
MAKKTKPQIEKLARTTSESLVKHTGFNWDQWIVKLKKAGADLLTHKEIVALLKTKFKVTPWWQQIIASGYEIHIGKKIEGQNEKGLYQVTVTKMMNIAPKKMWDFLSSPEGLNVWLKPLSEFHMEKGESFEVSGGIFGEVRTIKPPEKVRLKWEDPDWARKSVVQIYVLPRPTEKNRCMLVIMHEELMNPRIKEKQRTYWKGIVTEIEEAIKA